MEAAAGDFGQAPSLAAARRGRKSRTSAATEDLADMARVARRRALPNRSRR
jgi:hypothetical protein